jgi:hypothetical protein
MLIALNRSLRLQRRRLMSLAAVLAVSGAIVTAHSAMGGDHMGGGAAACVAVLEIGALAVAAVASAPACAPLTELWARLPRPLAAVRPELAWPPEPRARAAPTVLQVFRL